MAIKHYLAFLANICFVRSVSRFANTLAIALSAQQMNASALASALGLATSSITRVVRGQRSCSNELAAAICRYFAFDSTLAHDLLAAHLLDVAAAAGADLDTLRISKSANPHAEWWAGLPPRLSEQLRGLGFAAMHDADFATVLADLEPLALKLLGALHDARELGRLREAQLYPFPTDASPSAVAEDSTPSSPSPSQGRRARPASALPRGRSQEPTA